MIYNNFILALALSAGLIDSAFAQGFRNGGFRGGRGSTSVAAVNTTAASSTTATAGGGAAATATTAAAAAAATSAAAGTGNGGNAALTLDPANVQDASASDGQANAEKGQSPSIT
jgi:hypothetical protein